MRSRGLRGLTATYGSTSAFTYGATSGTGPLQSARNGDAWETRASRLCPVLAAAPSDARPADAVPSARTPAALTTALRDHTIATPSLSARSSCLTHGNPYPTRRLDPAPGLADAAITVSTRRKECLMRK